jgi:hypothetical protein
MVSGSHSGGISSARFTLAVRPLLSVFNDINVGDANVGDANAGIAGLALLQTTGLAVCAAVNTSACTGVAHSTHQ